MADFSNYELSEIAEHEFGVYQLADELIPEIAEELNFDITGQPVQDALGDFIGKFAPDKELQKNISLVQEQIPVDVAADWVERSGVLEPVSRAFRDTTKLPERVGMAVMTGGVANWMLRRAAVLERLDPTTIPRVWLVASDRKMSDGEHQLVRSHRELFSEHEIETTEYRFMRKFVMTRLADAWFNVRDFHSEGHTQGSAILDDWVAYADKVDNALRIKTILVPGNAPAVIQTAVTVREAIQKLDPLFDNTPSPQLFMVSDTIPIARHGEGTATHQNPYSALGQILRNAKYLDKAAAQLRAA